ncbi:MAG: DUF1559 domain-containing protein [Armatimonadota bacterium]|nr:DUF1559 domain-containing protein [bacterium]MDW8320020.1 DUF1559 domain-containing protein [Armatimonadota bacterium]
MNKMRAFTLIELLVVIAIIAILAAILFPVFAQARDTARQSSCLSNMKQLTLGLLQYAQDYDERFGAWDTNFYCAGGNNGLPRDSSAFWTMAIYPYVKNDGVYQCPNDPLKINDLWTDPAFGCTDDGGRNDRFAPINPTTGVPCRFWEGCNPRYVSYGLSENLTQSFPSNSMAAIPTPASWAMFFDSGVQLVDNWVYIGSKWYNDDWIMARVAFAKEGCCKIWQCCWTAEQWLAQFSRSVLDSLSRHRAGANVTYVDGHAKYSRWTELTWKNTTFGAGYTGPQ